MNNAATLRKSAGSGVSSLVLAVNNTGTVQALAGYLSLDGGGSSSGVFQAGPACTNAFGGFTHTLLAGTRFEGDGLFTVWQNYTATTLSFAAPILITNRFELNNGGVIGGTNVGIFAGPFTWIGGQLGEAGRTVFTNSATVTITTGNTKRLRTRTVDNHTTVTYSGTALLADNFGVWNNQSGSVFDVQNDYGIAFGGLGGYATFNNFGTFKKSAGTALADTQLNMRNATAGSIVRSQTGILGFSVSYIQTNGLTELAGGNFSGALFDIRGGTLSGAGNIAANVLNNGTVLPGGSVGRLAISNNVAQTFTALTNSLLTFEIGGLTPGTGHDQIRANNGTATLAGTLRAVLANGYIPTAGNTYTVMTFTARSGVLTNFSFPDYQFGVVHTATEVILIASNAIPAVQLDLPATQLVCTPFLLQTAASDLDGGVTNLSVFLGADLLASFPNGSLRELTVEYDFPGAATFKARATDNLGAVRETNFTAFFTTLPLHVLQLGGPRTNGVFKLCMFGEAGSNYTMLAMTNVSSPLSNWTSLGRMKNTNGIWRYLDNGTLTNRAYRFYRAQQQ